MKLAPLSDRTFAEYRDMGYPLDSPPKRCILIEHRGAIIAAAEMTETEGGQFLMLHHMFVVSYVDADLQTKSVIAILRAARAYSNITGQRCLGVLPGAVIDLMIEDGWSPVVGGAMFNPFLRAPDAPVLPRRAAAPEVRPEPQRRQEPEVEQGEPEEPAPEEDEDDVELVSSLQQEVARQASVAPLEEPGRQAEREAALRRDERVSLGLVRRPQEGSSPAKRAVRKRQPTAAS